MATYKIPTQNLSLSTPDEGQLFVKKGSSADSQIILGYKKGNQYWETDASQFSTIPLMKSPPKPVYRGGPMDLGEWNRPQERSAEGASQLKNLYGVDWASLPQYHSGDIQTSGTQLSSEPLDWTSILKGGNLQGTPGGTTTRTIDPTNPHKAIDVAGDVPSGAPADYLQKLLGTGQGAGGAYLNTPAQAQALYPSLQNEVASRAGASGGPATDPLSSIRNVFGADWQPAPAFKDLQSQGIYGAVRVGDSPNVFTLGPGGTMETAESYRAKFGTDSQEGIVGQITPEQANQLGINPSSVNTPPLPPGGATGAGQGATGADTGATGDPRDAIIKKLTNAVADKTVKDATAEAPVKTFEQEYLDAQNLLTTLENNLKAKMFTEEGRLAPMDIIGARQAAWEKILNPERQDLLSKMKTATTQRGFALDEMSQQREDTKLDLDIMSGKYQTPAEKEEEELKSYEEKLKLQQQYKDKQIVGTAETGFYAVNPNTGEKTLVVPPKPSSDGGDSKTEKAIISAVNDYKSSYATAGEGFREQVIDSLIKRFGSANADFITEQVYLKMPSETEKVLASSDISQFELNLGIKPGMTESEADAIMNSDPTVADYHAELRTIFEDLKKNNYTKGEAETKWKNSQDPVATSIPRPIKKLFNEIW